MADPLVWSKAETHCVWCRAPFVDDMTCPCQATKDALSGHDAVAGRLLATIELQDTVIEAQAGAIARLRAGFFDLSAMGLEAPE